MGMRLDHLGYTTGDGCHETRIQVSTRPWWRDLLDGHWDREIFISSGSTVWRSRSTGQRPGTLLEGELTACDWIWRRENR